jgi:hypothetical protein
MDGEIDIYLNRWRNVNGVLSLVPVNSHGQRLCPICYRNGEVLVLLWRPDQPVWSCPYQHSFQSTPLPVGQE